MCATDSDVVRKYVELTYQNARKLQEENAWATDSDIGDTPFSITEHRVHNISFSQSPIDDINLS
jgi:hypothetical protein